MKSNTLVLILVLVLLNGLALFAASSLVFSNDMDFTKSMDPAMGRYSSPTETELSGNVGETDFSHLGNKLSSSSAITYSIMCKDHDDVFNPVDSTTIFSPSDTKAECLSFFSIDNKIEWRWYYRSDSAKGWDHYWTDSQTPGPGQYRWWCAIWVAENWPGDNYPRGWKVDVYLDDSYSLSHFFEVTDGGLTQHVMCADVIDGNPIDVKDTFVIGVDPRAYHYVRLDNVAYYSEVTGNCHDAIILVRAPNGTQYYSIFSWSDYKDRDPALDYWDWCYDQHYIEIETETAVGVWEIELYLDTYYDSEVSPPLEWIPYRGQDNPIATISFEIVPFVSEPVYKWDNPSITWEGTGEDFDWSGWGGYWFRHGTEGIAFTFTGISKAKIVSEWVNIEFNLGITNCLDGEKGLDGLLDVIINPGHKYVRDVDPGSITITNVLFDNLDTTNHACSMTDESGTYRTVAQIIVHKNYIVDGTIEIKVVRHVDLPLINDHATAYVESPIDLGTQENPTPNVPSDVYENDDPHTVHVYVGTTDGTGAFAADGEVVMRQVWSSIKLPGDINCDGIVDIFDIVATALDLNKKVWEQDPPTEGTAKISAATAALVTVTIVALSMNGLRKNHKKEEP